MSMTIEPGKYYRTRYGKKAYVIGIVPEEICVFQASRVAGVVYGSGGWEFVSWDRTGAWWMGREDAQDIVAPWTDEESQ